MHLAKYYMPAKLTFLTVVITILSGCYSLDENKFCPFGMGFMDDTDFSAPVIVDGKNNEVSRKEQKALLKASRLYSSKIINDTYDLAEYLCTNEGLPEDKYQQLENIAKIYVYSGIIYPWTWSGNGKVQRTPLLQALENNDKSHIITGTICVTGLCTQTAHEAFCKNRERATSKNDELTKKLTDYYLAEREYKLTYPKEKSMSYCKGPKW